MQALHRAEKGTSASDSDVRSNKERQRREETEIGSRPYDADRAAANTTDPRARIGRPTASVRPLILLLVYNRFAMQNLRPMFVGHLFWVV